VFGQACGLGRFPAAFDAFERDENTAIAHGRSVYGGSRNRNRFARRPPKTRGAVARNAQWAVRYGACSSQKPGATSRA
jgi:hypothetical protein